MNVTDHSPQQRIKIFRLLKNLNSLEYPIKNKDTEAYIYALSDAGLINNRTAMGEIVEVCLSSQGYLFMEQLSEWHQTTGKLGFVELAILEKISSNKDTNVNNWNPLETELGEANLAEIKTAIAELENSGLIKSFAVMEAKLPISLIGLNGYQHTLHTKNPPAWQHEEKYSNMTTNNNISIGDHATVGVAGTNSGIAVTGSSIMLSPDQIQSIHKNIDKLQSEIEKDELVPTEASKAIGGILADAKNKIANTTKEEAKKILEDTAQEATDSARNYLKGMVLEGVSALLGTLPAFIQSFPM